MINANKGTSELEKQKRSASKVRPGNRGRKYKHVLFSQVIKWTLDFPTYLVVVWGKTEREAELSVVVAVYQAGREVKVLTVPLLCVEVCWQLPHGVKHFVCLTLFNSWEKQMQETNVCADARTKIQLISFLANQNKGCSKFPAFQESIIDVGLIL